MTEVRVVIPTTTTSTTTDNEITFDSSKSKSTSISTTTTNSLCKIQNGLFATKEYQVGDIIIDQEDVLIRFYDDDKNNDSSSSSSTDDHNDNDDNHQRYLFQRYLQIQLQNISLPTSLLVVEEGTKKDNTTKGTNVNNTSSSTSAAVSLSKFISVLQVALYYIHTYDNKTKWTTEKQNDFFQLYYPPLFNIPSSTSQSPNDDDNNSSTSTSTSSVKPTIYEQKAITFTEVAIRYLQKYCIPGTKLHSYFQKKEDNHMNHTDKKLKTPPGMNHNDNNDNINLNNDPIVTLQKVILIYLCNAFQGQRIYKVISRMNHSCDPNCIVQTATTNSAHADHKKNQKKQNKNVQSIIAAVPISIGDELTISYLGLFLYTDTVTRQRILQTDKYFTCLCTRCSGCTIFQSNNNNSRNMDSSIPCPEVPTIQNDTAGAIPCPIEYPRNVLGPYELLEEDIQYDDENTVLYSYPRIIRTTTTSDLKVETTSKDEEEVIIVSYVSTSGNVCSSNDILYQKLFNTMQIGMEKVLVFLQDHEEWNRNTSGGLQQQQQQQQQQKKTKNKNKRKHRHNNNDDEDDDDDGNFQEQQQIQYRKKLHHERLEQLLRFVSTIFGNQHWTTNLLMLLHLDIKLQKYHQVLLQQQTGFYQNQNDDSDNDDDDENIPMEEQLAECIDMMERIYSFFIHMQQSKSVRLHVGHVLCHVLIGIARGLVNLGDQKSQVYAQEWLQKINHVHQKYDDDSSNNTKNNTKNNNDTNSKTNGIIDMDVVDSNTMDVNPNDTYSYVAFFESEGIQKVVETLQNAWRRTPE